MKNRLTTLFHRVNLLHENAVLAKGRLAAVRAEPRVIDVDLGH